jgi:hypothetical protein
MRAINDKVLLQPAAVHDIDGLLKLVQVLFQMMMQIDADGRGRDPFTGTDKQRIVELPRRRCSDWLTAEGVI